VDAEALLNIGDPFHNPLEAGRTEPLERRRVISLREGR
jgi:hypothetical protein